MPGETAPAPPAATTPEAAAAADLAITPDRVRLWEDDFMVVHAEIDGAVHDDIRARRLFPLSGKADYVSLVSERNQEVALLAHPDRLDKASRAVLEHALERLYYRATILRVDQITETLGVSFWEVFTDRGYARFEVVDRQQHIRILPGGRFVITDVDGNRFEIPDFRRLDARSQALIETET
ncbi:MAG: DUF1854 domain-containing protein [Lentisphaerae bacterium]|nr:DUF1854 domain-containing protein [Lentisphaerota bacterium]